MKWIVVHGNETSTVDLTDEEEEILVNQIGRLDVVSETFCNVPLIDLSLLDEEFFRG